MRRLLLQFRFLVRVAPPVRKAPRATRVAPRDLRVTLAHKGLRAPLVQILQSLDLKDPREI